MLEKRYQVKQVVNQFREALKQEGINPERIILFGSYAKGLESSYSDIDLVVVSQDFYGLSLLERCERMGRVIAKMMEPIEPIAYTPAEFEHLSPLSFIGSITHDPEQYVDL